MKVKVRVWGGVSFINALIGMYGSAMAVKLPLILEVEESDRWLGDQIAKAIFEEIGLKGKFSVKVSSEIPQGVGLKSSSAYTASLAIAGLAFKGNVDVDEAVKVSAKVSKRLGLSFTGAYDDAYASVLGGIVLTDNSTGKLISRFEAPSAWKVTIAINEELKKTVNQGLLEKFKELTDLLIRYVKERNFWAAALLNSLIVSSSNGYPKDPFIKAASTGAIAGISGNGPAYFAIKEGEPYVFEGMKNIFSSPANEGYLLEVH